MSIELVAITGIYVLFALIAAGMMAVDKTHAEENMSRIPETSLLFFATLGWPGAKLSQQFFRHKTRKQPFAFMLWIAGGAHVLVWSGFLIWVQNLPG